jgi:hypothetical protein
MDTAEGNVESNLPMSLGSRRRSVNRPQLSPGDLGAGGNLEKVRDLLFGAQMRDMENHFARLEEGVTGCPRRLHAANGSSPSSRVSIGSTNSRYGYKRWVSFSMRYRMKSSQSPLR